MMVPARHPFCLRKTGTRLARFLRLEARAPQPLRTTSPYRYQCNTAHESHHAIDTANCAPLTPDHNLVCDVLCLSPPDIASAYGFPHITRSPQPPKTPSLFSTSTMSIAFPNGWAFAVALGSVGLTVSTFALLFYLQRRGRKAYRASPVNPKSWCGY